MITSIVQLVKDCCQESQLVPPSESLKNIVAINFQNLAPVDKWSLIQKMDREFSQKKSDLQQVKLFKKTLCLNSTANWKNHLLETQYEVKIDIFHKAFQFSNSVDCPLTIKDRIQCTSGKQICSAIGSTFCTSKPEAKKNEHLV